jgi:predicted RNA-binding Zn ribbon-like protein
MQECTNSGLIVGFANSGTALTAWLARCAAEPTVSEPTAGEPTVSEPTVARPTVGEPTIDEADVVAARELRAALLTLLRAHSGCVNDDTEVRAAQAYLRRIAVRYPLVPQINAEGCVLVPAQTGVLGVFGALLAAVTELAYQGGWPRVKVCRNSACHEAFFDRTRNSSGLYCGTACSSQVAMRAYRSRQKTAHAGAPEPAETAHASAPEPAEDRVSAPM